jgi:predicted nucleic acid-binding protein
LKPRRLPGLRQRVAAYLPDAFAIDCSVCLPWYFRDEANEFCDRIGIALHRSEVWAPSLWRAELVSAVVNAQRRKRISAGQREDVLKNAHELPLRIDYEMPSILVLNELSRSYDLTPYDAVYLELARRRKLPLATLDAALIKAARSAKVALLHPEK